MKKKNIESKYLFRRVALAMVALLVISTAVFFALDSNSSEDTVDNTTDANAQEQSENVAGDTTGADENKEPVEPVEPEPEPIPEDINITMSAVGDIMFHPKNIRGGYDATTGTYDYMHYFDAIQPYIQAADIAVGNFEGTTCGDDIYAYQGYPLFNAPDEVLDALKETGFDVLSTANNHSLDTRKVGVIRTIEKMDERGIAHVGTYVEKPETRVLMQDVEGIKIAFLSYTEMLNGLDSVLTAEDLDAMINKLDETKITEDIAYAQENEADLIVMMVHWGYEYHHSPNDYQLQWADFMIEAGVDIILGGHSHVMQSTENFIDAEDPYYIVYSMGNFISNQRREEEQLPPETEAGIVITFDIKKDGATGEVTIEGVNYNPTWVYRAYVPETGQYTYKIVPVMDYVESEEYDEVTRDKMADAYNTTMSILDENFVITE